MSRATRQGTASSKHFGPSPAVAAWEGHAGEQDPSSSKTAGYGIPYIPALPPVRTTRWSEDFRETPRLVVDSLQGNVFVNQYLIIKQLGRGAHGSVKLVFDTEQQLVHAMKVIHRKGGRNAAARRNSLSLTLDSSALYANSTGMPVSTGSPAVGQHSALLRGHSLSADASHMQAYQAQCAGVVSGGLTGFSRSNSVSPFPGASSPCKSGPSFTAAYAAAMGAAVRDVEGSSANISTAQSEVLSAGARTTSSAVMVMLPTSEDGAAQPAQQQPQQQALLCFGSMTPLESLPLPASREASATAPQAQQRQNGDIAQATGKPAAAGEGPAVGAGPALGRETSNVTDNSRASADSVNVQVRISRASSTAAALQAATPAAAAPAAPSTTSTHNPGLSAADVAAVASSSTAAAAATQSAPLQSGRTSLLPGSRSVTPPPVGMPGSGRTSPAPLPLSAAVDATTSELAREIAVMKRLNHPNVVKLYEVIHDPDQKLLIMVMEFMPGGSILSSSRTPGLTTEPLPEPAARNYFRELVSAVDYLHSNLVMHGDLKPDNLLLSADGRLKISDFGSATLLPHATSLMTTTMGTPAFMAPEMCGLRSSPFAPFPAEVWAVGVCLFMFVYGRVPYVSSSAGALYEAIRSPDPVVLPDQPTISPQLANLLTRLLHKDPDTRIKLDEVLSHEWVTDGGKLPAVQHYSEAASLTGLAEAQAKEQGQVLTALKKQVKTAVPNVEERTYKKGSLLVQQGQVPEGLFLILSGTCELVLLSHVPEQQQQQQQQQGGTPVHSGKPSFTSKIAAAVTHSGRDSPSGLLRTQSSSPMFALPPKRDADIDFVAQLSDSDDTTDSGDDDWQQRQQQEQQEDCGGVGVETESDAVKPGFPFFRVTASADGARRLQSGGLMSGLPWSPSVGHARSPSPPPIIEGVPSVPSPDASGHNGGFFLAMQGQQSFSAAAGAEAEADEPVQLPSFSASGGRIPGAIASIPGSSVKAAAAAATVDERSHKPSVYGSEVPDAPRSLTLEGGYTPRSRASMHGKSCSVDFGAFAPEEPKPIQAQRSTGNLLHPKAAAAAGGAPGPLQRFQALQLFKRPGRHSFDRAASPVGLSYNTLTQASAPNLGCQLGVGPAASQGQWGSEGVWAAGGGGSPPPGMQVQRSANSVIVGASGKVYHRAMRRSESMHKRMVDLVAAAKMRTQTNSKRHELVGIRGPGQIIGDTSLNGKPAPAAATVRARSRMRVLLVRPADAAALVTQPSVKAALYRTQTESSVLDALETFAAYDGEVAAIDEVRRSRAASFAAAARGGLVGMGSGIPGLSGTQGSGQWLDTASSAGSSVLESYGSVASSLASFTSSGAAAAGSQFPIYAAAPASVTRSSPLPNIMVSTSPSGVFSLPPRSPSRTAMQNMFTPNPGAGGLTADAVSLGLAGGYAQSVVERGGSPVFGSTGSAGGSPLRPGSRGNSFTAGSSTPRGGLKGTSSRLGLSVQIGGQTVLGPGSGSPLLSPRF